MSRFGHSVRGNLPADLHPLVTAHPASCAYLAESRLEAQTWSHDDALAMARAVVALDRERQELKRLLWDIAQQEDGARVALSYFICPETRCVCRPPSLCTTVCHVKSLRVKPALADVIVRVTEVAA